MTARGSMHIARTMVIAFALACAAGMAAAGGCNVSVGSLAFGRYEPLSMPGQVTSVDSLSDASLSMVCSGIVDGGTYSIALGRNDGGTATSPRLMVNTGGGPPMQFNVFRDPGYSMIWGDGASGNAFSGTVVPGDSTRTFTAYGRVPARQSGLSAGVFSTSLVVTVTYNP